MPIRTVLFDLDGTLLPMDQETFVRAYFGLLARKLRPHGYDSEKLIAAIWQGTAAMVKNDGSRTNEEAFWQDFCTHFGDGARADEPIFDDYYRSEFKQVQSACGYSPFAQEAVSVLQEKGMQIALATNPIFPAVATESRIRWAGLDRQAFALVTTYENSRHCKPNPDYYRDVLSALDANPAETLMVGNDVGEDMIARKLGMQVYLVTDCLINKKDEDLSQYPHGTLEDLVTYLKTL